jgi:quercetin dioxygenase-like cupin family protein
VSNRFCSPHDPCTSPGSEGCGTIVAGKTTWKNSQMTQTEAQELIQHIDSMEKYSPPNHQGTVNVRLIDKSFSGSFEMNLGIVQPGGEAEPHLHNSEHQVLYVLEGACEVTLGDSAPQHCTPGTVVRIPPKLLHRVVAVGDAALKAIVIYSPPL